MNEFHDVTVCLCTYKRPKRLQRLLEELARQETAERFTYSIVIADNDKLESARPVVCKFAATSSVPVVYCLEPEQNIALVRNQALANARGEYIAFIDDDEVPEKDWLFQLFDTCQKYAADGVLGPVEPHFEQAPPQWIIKGGFYDRPTHATGFVIDWSEGRTGNLLFKRKIIGDIAQVFLPEFGSGGEDRDFFKRMIESGRVFVWCNEAVVYETVPPIRWKRSFMLRRALLRGKVSLVGPNSRISKVAKSAIAVPAYTIALPFLLVSGQHRFMKYLIKTFDHLGRILSFLGIDVVKEKYVTE
jgi:succinoglycan biosynthesis protein ExoM